MPKRILVENQNAGFGVDTVVPIVRVDPVTITQLHARAEIDIKKNCRRNGPLNESRPRPIKTAARPAASGGVQV